MNKIVLTVAIASLLDSSVQAMDREGGAINRMRQIEARVTDHQKIKNIMCAVTGLLCCGVVANTVINGVEDRPLVIGAHVALAGATYSTLRVAALANQSAAILRKLKKQHKID